MSKNNAAVQIIFGLMLLTWSTVSFGAQEITYDAGERRDPFVPLNAADSAFGNTVSSGVRIEGIIYDPIGRSMAILNGKSYQVGDAVGEARVVKIQKDHVVISAAGEEKTLLMREEDKK